jgi:hypothetical protein
MPVELDLGDMEDEEEEWDLEHEEVEVWDGTTRIRNGTVIGRDIVGMNVSWVFPTERVELIAGIQRFPTSSRWFRSTHSITRILATDAQVREYGITILYSKPRVWQVDLARKAKCQGHHHERRGYRRRVREVSAVESDLLMCQILYRTTSQERRQDENLSVVYRFLGVIIRQAPVDTPGDCASYSSSSASQREGSSWRSAGRGSDLGCLGLCKLFDRSSRK